MEGSILKAALQAVKSSDPNRSRNKKVHHPMICFLIDGVPGKQEPVKSLG